MTGIYFETKIVKITLFKTEDMRCHYEKIFFKDSFLYQ